MRLAAPAALLLAAVWAGDDFLSLLRKANSRTEAAEKVHYYSLAIKAWDAARGSRTLLAQCHFGRGEAHLARDEADLAEADLSKTVQLDPRNVQALFLRGRANLRRGRVPQALRDLSEAAALEPKAERLLRLGEAQERAERWPQALESYRKAEELDRRDFRPCVGRARAALRAGDLLEAAGALAAAEERASDPEPDILASQSRLQSARGRVEEALAALKKAIALYEERLAGFRRSGERSLEATEVSERLAEAASRLGALQPTVPEPKPLAKPRRKKGYFKPSGDPGERIYAN